MVWIFIGVAMAATALLKLGALSVWVGVLSTALLSLISLAVVMAGIIAWQYFFRSKS